MPRSLNAIRSYRLSCTPPLKQKELGARVGCTQADISAYETGKVIPALPKALGIARALGRSVEDVFFDLAGHAQARPPHDAAPEEAHT